MSGLLDPYQALFFYEAPSCNSPGELGAEKNHGFGRGGREVESQGWAVVLTVPDLGGEDHFIWM